MQSDLEYLTDHRSSPDERSVLEDMERERFRASTVSRLGYALYGAADAADAADADDAAAAAADDAADAADADAADAAAAADDAAADDAAADDDDDAADDAADDDDRRRRLNKLLTEEPDMKNGLKIIQLPGRYSGWAVTRVGWLRRVSGDEWELIGARTIIRTGAPRTLDSLASGGPGRDHRLSAAAAMPEDIHRLLVRRSMRADEVAWAEHCPRPADWVDD